MSDLVVAYIVCFLTHRLICGVDLFQEYGCLRFVGRADMGIYHLLPRSVWDGALLHGCRLLPRLTDRRVRLLNPLWYRGKDTWLKKRRKKRNGEISLSK